MVDQVDEIKQKIDIVTVIGERVELKKAGRNYKALCPFHSEKTPSFMVSQELQVFKCFGCGESGDVFSFLEKFEGMDFYEALKYLAEKTGIKLRETSGYVHSEKEKLFEINKTASYFYSWVLKNHPSGKAALDYLIKDRELLPNTLSTFTLGYSPESAFALRKYLTDKKKYSFNDIEKTGIFYLKEGQLLDRFRGRVIFPLSDHRGNVVGFAGRILPKDANRDLAKYINTPETEIYHKSKVLYGLNLTKADIKRCNQVVIVEGELDAISSWQAGIKDVVAIKGSALTNEQARLISRLTKKVVLGLDADFAGSEAAMRGIQIAENEGLDVRVMRLKGFKDPDEAARVNPELLKNAIESSVGVWDFIIDTIFSRQKGEGVSEKTANVSRDVIPVLLSISDKIVQAHYIETVAKKLSVPTDAVIEEMKRHESTISRSNVGQTSETVKPIMKERRDLLEERLLSIIFQSDPKYLLNNKIRAVIKTPLSLRILDEFLLFCRKSKKIDLKRFSRGLPEELVDGFRAIVIGNLKDSDKDETRDNMKEIVLIVRELKILTLKHKLQKSEAIIKDLEAKGEKRKLRKEQKRFSEFTRKLNDLESSDIRGIIL